LSDPLETSSPASTSSRVESPRLVEGWADLARALAIYPVTNSRVVRSLDAFLEVLRASFVGPASVVEVCFNAGVVWVDEDAFDLKPGSNPAWLKDRLDRADLSGTAFSEETTEASMLAFTQRLLELYARQDLDLDFKDLWPAPHAGITLLERRFDGPFLAGGEAAGGPARSGILGRASRKVKLLRNALSLDPRVRGTIDRFQSRLVSAAGASTQFGTIDIIAEIVDVLPAEGLHDFATAVEMTERILSALEGELVRGPTGAARREENAAFRRLVFLISRSHFNTIEASQQPRTVPSEVKDQPKPTPVQEFHLHARDAEILDDLGALLSEVERLGPASSGIANEHEVSDPAEELGVYLHYLVTHDDPSKFPTLSAGIGRLLEPSGEAGTVILRRYLEASRELDARVHGLHLGRVATWLRKNGHKEYLEKCGLLSAEWVIHEFPEEFLVYVETLDLDDPRDVKTLDRVCQAIGPDRFHDATELLSDASEFVAGPIPDHLFRLSLTSIGPLLRRIYEKDRRRFEPDFARYVRHTTASKLDLAILDVVGTAPSGLQSYWQALSENDTETLPEQRAQIVYAFLSETEGDPARLEQHVRAINLLANFDTPRTREYLNRLIGEASSFVLKKHPRAARAAAANVLRVLDKRGI
jgi:hypothetical protein